MNIRKFVAATTRQALKEIRDELGDEAVILSNRQTSDGVEMLASVSTEMMRWAEGETPRKVEAKVASPVPPAAAPIPPVQAANEHILDEIRSMHCMLQQQLAELSWVNAQRQQPEQAGLLRRLLNVGFSSALAHQLLQKMPADVEQGEAWLKQVLKRNLHVVSEADDLVSRGGVYALIGPTGVGKTTTTAKLAARAVVRYGADKVALLTTDSYRIGAYEQLKIYGKILGVAVHAVKDTDDLRLTLSALKHKHLVLIDTVGMGQRDERVCDQNEMFDATGVQRLLLLNASVSGDTLEEVVRKYQGAQVIGCIATKLDEAVTVGAVLDVAIRHRLVLHYMANGQRVPEDLHPINPDYLLHRALKPAEAKSAFTLEEVDFPMLMSAEGSSHSRVPVAATQGLLQRNAAQLASLIKGEVNYAR